jgi:hypothetical protein
MNSSVAEDSSDAFVDSPEALEEEDDNALVGVEKEGHNQAICLPDQLSTLCPGDQRDPER